MSCVQRSPGGRRQGAGRGQKRDSSVRREAGGFTLLEIMLALALIALDKPVSPEDVFWRAVQQARKSALTNERDVRLSFTAKDLAFVLDDGTASQSLPVPSSRDLTVNFLSAQAGGASVLIGGEVVDAQTIPFVTFYVDGTCSPFRVQFRGTGAARILAIDPWTCAKVLPRVEGTP
jgi:prepilin-type N-terminal cleavage/methylation domain-containing protein